MSAVMRASTVQSSPPEKSRATLTLVVSALGGSGMSKTRACNAARSCCSNCLTDAEEDTSLGGLVMVWVLKIPIPETYKRK
jgi:hypothetical protein